MTAVMDRLRALPGWQVTLTGALFVLGFLIAAQLSAEGPRIRYTTQERAPLIETALGLQDQQDALQARILQLREEIVDLEADEPGSEALVRELNAALEHARIAGGLVQISGPGIVFRLEDAENPGAERDSLVTARDIRTLVQELWLAGAEAISINSERVTTGTAVLDIGNAILANSAYLTPPYEVSAIGPDDLYARMAGTVSFVEFVQSRIEPYGLRLSFAELASVTVPAYAGTIRSRYARPDASASPEP
ncbi:MAG TPA: DUF881 domain-containing protein [Candidatus Limnocylindrales bacterium]|nr:DUF881 domain-containing protein [Candidatus Limnocylindrales bacterium]